MHVPQSKAGAVSCTQVLHGAEAALTGSLLKSATGGTVLKRCWAPCSAASPPSLHPEPELMSLQGFGSLGWGFGTLGFAEGARLLQKTVVKALKAACGSVVQKA